MDDSASADPSLVPSPPASPSQEGLHQALNVPAVAEQHLPSRSLALLQVIAVSGIPTQVVIATTLILVFGMPAPTRDGLSLELIATVSFLDTALVSLLILLFLTVSREKSRDVFLGDRPPLPELVRGLLLVPVAFIVVGVLVSIVRILLPALHNVEESPLAAFMTNPLDTAIFAVVVVLAGGVREELQRGFIVHRFGQRLGGKWTGNLVFGVAFGLLHMDQGWDISLVIGLLGLAWGAAYIHRRSVVMSIANHAGFNAAQVVQQVVVTSLGLGR